MPWESRATSQHRYYTKTLRCDGRVVRKYLGRGPAAQQAAEIDELRRQLREQERVDRLAQAAAWDQEVAPLLALNDVADALMDSALLAAGYHRPDRQAWKKRRHADAE